MNAVETRELTRTFGAKVAVDRLTLEVPTGQLFGLLGSNGAGKTTLIKMLTTLLPPTSGSASVAGFDVRRQPSRLRRAIGYVPQMISADGSLTGYENLLLSARLYDIPRAECPRRIDEALRFMGLDDVGHRMVNAYSGGMIRRLEIAQSMLHRPQVLFLDEPTIGLDPLARTAVWERLRQLRDEIGTTIVLTTHAMDEAEALCDTVAILHRGALAVAGAPADLVSSIGVPDATMEDVFGRYAGAPGESLDHYRDVSRTRRTAGRVG